MTSTFLLVRQKRILPGHHSGAKYFLRFLFESVRKNMNLPIDYYDGPEVSIDDIENHLLRFQGGSIDLHKQDDGFATLCINHYEKRNAISGSMMVQLRRAVEELERWREGRAVLLYGAGGTFCSGGDLGMARASATAREGFLMASYMGHVLQRLQHLPLLSAAFIQGSGALGGGAEVALACDWRLAARDARGVGVVHARMGIVPAWGGAGHLVALLGRSRALELLATARVVAPAEALTLGLLDAVLPAAGAGADALQTALAWLRERARFAPAVLRAAKSACDAPALRLDERRVFAPLWGGPFNRQALDQRPAHFHDSEPKL